MTYATDPDGEKCGKHYALLITTEDIGGPYTRCPVCEREAQDKHLRHLAENQDVFRRRREPAARTCGRDQS